MPGLIDEALHGLGQPQRVLIETLLEVANFVGSHRESPVIRQSLQMQAATLKPPANGLAKASLQRSDAHAQIFARARYPFRPRRRALERGGPPQNQRW